MLHAEFRGNRTIRSGEEDLLRVFTINGCGGHLGHVTQMPRTNFRSPYPRRLHIKFGGPAVSEKKMFEHCERQTPDHWYTISSPMCLWLR